MIRRLTGTLLTLALGAGVGTDSSGNSRGCHVHARNGHRGRAREGHRHVPGRATGSADRLRPGDRVEQTGDRRQTIFSAQTLANMLERFGVTVPADQIKIENIAAVLVTAELPPFVRQGGRLDVTASSIGDARSLQVER